MLPLDPADGPDTALARALNEWQAVPLPALQACLQEVREHRARGAPHTLAALLLERGLASATALEDAVCRLEAGSTAGAGVSAPGAVRRFGPYRVVKELARGGMGTVFEVVHEPTGAARALKTIHDLDAEGLARFRAEAEALGRLDHPHVVRVHEANLEGGVVWLAQDLAPGGTLERRMAGPDPISVTEGVTIAQKLARGLQHAHERGVLHRDLKPANVLFDGRGEPQLTDFGLARLASRSTRLTATGAILGTPAYMAPEQARSEEADARTDVYGLGALLWASLAGRPPFQGAGMFAVLEAVLHRAPPSIRELRPDVPEPVAQVIGRAMARDRAARPATAEAFAAALERALEASGPPALGRVEGRPGLRSAALGGLVVAALALGVALTQRVVPDAAPGGGAADADRRGSATVSDPGSGAPSGVEPAPATDAAMAAALVERGEALMRGGEPQGALVAYTRALELDPRLLQAWCGRCVVKIALGELNGAVEDAVRAIALDPWSTPLHLRAGNGGDDPREALFRHAADAAAQRPDDARLGCTYVALQLTWQGGWAQDCDRLIGLAPHMARTWELRGMARMRHGDRRGAVEDCTRAIELEPRSPLAYVTRASAQRAIGIDRAVGNPRDVERAVEDCTEAIELDPRLPMAWLVRGQARKELDRFEEAASDLARAIELEPRWARPHYHRGQLREGLGDIEGALSDYRRAVDLFPGGELLPNEQEKRREAELAVERVLSRLPR